MAEEAAYEKGRGRERGLVWSPAPKVRGGHWCWWARQTARLERVTWKLEAAGAAVEVAVGRGYRGLPASRAEAQAAILGSRPLLRNSGEAGRALNCLWALLQKVWQSHDKSAALSPFLLTFQGGVRWGVPGAPVGTGLPARGQRPLWREPGPARGSPGAVHVVHTHTRHGSEDPMNTRPQACEHTPPPPRGGHSGHYRRPCCCRSPSPCTDSPRPYRCPSKLAPHLAHLEAGAGLLGRSVRCTPGFCPCKPAAPTSGPTLGPLRTAPWLGLAGESPGQSGAPRTR